jgi:hypothetical protein
LKKWNDIRPMITEQESEAEQTDEKGVDEIEEQRKRVKFTKIHYLMRFFHSVTQRVDERLCHTDGISEYCST